MAYVLSRLVALLCYVYGRRLHSIDGEIPPFCHTNLSTTLICDHNMMYVVLCFTDIIIIVVVYGFEYETRVPKMTTACYCCLRKNSISEPRALSRFNAC